MALYALRIKSQFPRKLYAYLFYFSTTGQSIRPLYLGVYGSYHIDPSLEPYGELTCGYINDDMIPGALSFGLTPDDGYFQLFLTTAPGDFDSLAQPSPFIDPQTDHTISAGITDQYGDGLESRKHSSLGLCRTEPLELAKVPSGAFDGHSTEVLITQAFDVTIFERQNVSMKKRSEHSERAALPESAVLELFAEHDIAVEAARWGVVNLKVKCR
ncbi:unnamed protein product [Rhizoctonia solani]|uniref:Uncharacterized protein n=1 Tax=Rhizoctonia solani TaxID=456999 RepID=A0A8H3B9F4_9AGAM|nr:unnamed protein product [Rhizoctonia solani]